MGVFLLLNPILKPTSSSEQKVVNEMDSPIEELSQVRKKVSALRQKIECIRIQSNGWNVAELEQLCQEAQTTTDEVRVALASIDL